MSPPCALTAFRAMASPRPRPVRSAPRWSPNGWNGSPLLSGIVPQHVRGAWLGHYAISPFALGRLLLFGAGTGAHRDDRSMDGLSSIAQLPYQSQTFVITAPRTGVQHNHVWMRCDVLGHSAVGSELNWPGIGALRWHHIGELIFFCVAGSVWAAALLTANRRANPSDSACGRRLMVWFVVLVVFAAVLDSVHNTALLRNTGLKRHTRPRRRRRRDARPQSASGGGVRGRSRAQPARIASKHSGSAVSREARSSSPLGRFKGYAARAHVRCRVIRRRG